MTKFLIFVDVSTMAVIAQADIIDGWGKLGAIGVLGILLAILLYKTLPDMSKNYRESRVEDSKIQADAMDKLTNSIDKLQETMSEGNKDQLTLLRANLMGARKDELS